MAAPSIKEGTLGILTYLLVAGAMAVTFLLGALLVGSAAVQDRISFPSLGQTLDSGSAFVTALVSFFVALPLLVAGVATLFGRRGGLSGSSLRGASGLNALIGIPLSYIVFALALLLASGLIGEDGRRSAFSAVLDLAVEGFLFMLITLGPLVGFAALVTHVTQQVFGGTHAAMDSYGGAHLHGGHEHHHHEHHHHDHDHGEGDHAHVHELHINCPRCGTEFIAEGERPLRIACPNCGKTGTIR